MKKETLTSRNGEDGFHNNPQVKPQSFPFKARKQTSVIPGLYKWQALRVNIGGMTMALVHDFDPCVCI